MPIVLAPEAEWDIQDIAHYTREKHGLQQAADYLALIEHKLLALVDFPELGYRHPAAPVDCRVFPVGKHLAVYRYRHAAIEVLNILHPSMDITTRLAQARAREESKK